MKSAPERARVQIALLGECMVELSEGPGGRLSRGIGGDTYNSAIYLARCDRERQIDVHYVTALGDDRFSDEIRAFLRREQVGDAMVLTYPGEAPGLYMIHLDEKGERSFSYWRSNAPARKLFRHPRCGEMLQTLLEVDWIHLSGISLAVLYDEDREHLLAFLQRFREAGGKVAFDINYRPRLWKSADEARRWIERVYRLCDLALPSLEDENALFSDDSADDVIRRLQNWGCAEIIVKAGAAPCVLWADEQLSFHPFEARSAPVDSTAAGDSFNAGYLWARLSGALPVDAIKAGQALASQVIMRPGAVVDIDPPALDHTVRKEPSR